MEFNLIVAVGIVVHDERLRADIVDGRSVLPRKLPEIRTPAVDGDMAVFPDVHPKRSEHVIVVRKKHRIRAAAFAGPDAPAVVRSWIRDILAETGAVIELVGETPRLPVADKLKFVYAPRRKRNKSADRKKEYRRQCATSVVVLHFRFSVSIFSHIDSPISPNPGYSSIIPHHAVLRAKTEQTTLFYPLNVTIS